MFKLNEPTDVSTHVLWKKLVEYLNQNIHLVGGGVGGTAFYIRDVTSVYDEDGVTHHLRRVRVVNGALDTTQIIPYEDAIKMKEGTIDVDDIIGLDKVFDDFDDFMKQLQDEIGRVNDLEFDFTTLLQRFEVAVSQSTTSTETIMSRTDESGFTHPSLLARLNNQYKYVWDTGFNEFIRYYSFYGGMNTQRKINGVWTDI